MGPNNLPIWNLNTFDPRNHLGARVVNDRRRTKPILRCRIAHDVTSYVGIPRPGESYVGERDHKPALLQRQAT